MISTQLNLPKSSCSSSVSVDSTNSYLLYTTPSLSHSSVSTECINSAPIAYSNHQYLQYTTPTPLNSPTNTISVPIDSNNNRYSPYTTVNPLTPMLSTKFDNHHKYGSYRPMEWTCQVKIFT